MVPVFRTLAISSWITSQVRGIRQPTAPATATTDTCENESLAALQLHRQGCSTPSQDCRSTGCCVDAGYTCYEKDAYWAGCRESCQPGQPAPTDPPEHRSPWTCAVIGCATTSEDCRSSGCCANEGYTCYEKNEFWAGCRPSCQPGEPSPTDPPEYQTPWTCSIIGETTRKPSTRSTTSTKHGSTTTTSTSTRKSRPTTSTSTRKPTTITSTTKSKPTTRTSTTKPKPTTSTTKPKPTPGSTTLTTTQYAYTCVADSCSVAGEDCRSTGCCADPGYSCYQKNDYWAGCRQWCTPGQPDANDPPEYQTPWSCDPVSRPSVTDPYATLPPFPGRFFATGSAGSGRSRIYQWIDTLTDQPVPGSPARAVHSSGGAAGGVVSEGQGYGLLLTGGFLAALTPDDQDWHQMADYTYEMFRGWRRMCELSMQGSCQEAAGFLCSGHPCLPHWKFADNLTTVLATGSAPDGDADALTGMLLAVMAVERTSANNPPSWLQEVAQWAYSTCKQFYLSETVASASGKHRIVKLGACWGGWGDDGQNPSYHAPAVFRLCKEFMNSHKSYGDDDLDWDKVIKTTYAMFNATQCHSNGLISNWARVFENVGGDTLWADAHFSGSGTPGPEYGAEAARTTWRVALDYLLFPLAAGAATTFYLNPLTALLETKEVQCYWNEYLRIDPGCLVTSVHEGWSWNMFMAGPTFSSLVCPNDSMERVRQQELINAGGARVASAGIEDYYSGSWVAISTYTLEGGFIRAGSNAGLYGMTATTTGSFSSTTSTHPAVPTTEPPPDEHCSSVGEDCRPTRCCKDAGYACYEKDQYWASCLQSCQPGQINPSDPPEQRTPWSCNVLKCSTIEDDCRSTGCCADAGYTCYEKNEYWAGCRESCQPGQVNPQDPPDVRTPWSCRSVNLLTENVMRKSPKVEFLVEIA